MTVSRSAGRLRSGTGQGGRRYLDIPDVRALALHQDGRHSIPKDSSSIASGDGVDDRIHSSWSSPSLQMVIDGVWASIISGGICALT